MKVSDYIADFFASKNVNIIFGYIGGMITHLVDSIDRHPELFFIQTYHEQSAAIAAEGYARETRNIGVAISTSGPGATNMITGIANAYFDSIPVIYITGQVNSYEYKYQKPVRQLGFQETDVVEVVRPITKYAIMIDNPDNICYELEKAYYIALNGRMGPVLLDIMMDVQRAEIDPSQQKHFFPDQKRITALTLKQKEEISVLVQSAKRPMIVVGGGMIASDCIDKLFELNQKLNIPVVCSLMGKSAYPEDDSNFIGMIGSYGNRCANIAIANSDLLIALGTRLDTRQTGAKYQNFLKHGKIIHVDIDPGELQGHRLENRLQIEQDVSVFIEFMSSEELMFQNYSEWNVYIASIKDKYNQKREVERFVENKKPYKLIETINKYSKSNDIFCSDIGQNQMWTAQMLELTKGQRYFTSGGLAPMGYSIPAAVGAAFGNKERSVWALCGDGGFHISVQSLMLISQYNLPVKVVVINNESLGMITQFQELYFNKNMVATTSGGGYLVPKLEKISEAYNLPYYRVNVKCLGDVDFMQAIFSKRNCIIEFLTEGETKVSPKLEFDKNIENPSPYLDDNELRANMIVSE